MNLRQKNSCTLLTDFYLKYWYKYLFTDLCKIGFNDLNPEVLYKIDWEAHLGDSVLGPKGKLTPIYQHVYHLQLGLNVFKLVLLGTVILQVLQKIGWSLLIVKFE